LVVHDSVGPPSVTPSFGFIVRLLGYGDLHAKCMNPEMEASRTTERRTPMQWFAWKPLKSISAKAIAPKPRDNITYQEDNTQSRSATTLGTEARGAHRPGGYNSVPVFAGQSVSRCAPQGRRRGFYRGLPWLASAGKLLMCPSGGVLPDDLPRDVAFWPVWTVRGSAAIRSGVGGEVGVSRSPLTDVDDPYASQYGPARRVVRLRAIMTAAASAPPPCVACVWSAA
jgi:hypothetical protein